MLKWLQSETVAIQGVIVAGIAVGTSFGLGWTNTQVAAVTGFSAVVLALVARSQVTPVSK